MKNEDYILRWLNNELSDAEMEAFKASDDYENFKQIAFYSSQIEAPQVDADRSFQDLKSSLSLPVANKSTKVINLNLRSFLKIAAVLVVALFSSYLLFFNNDSYSASYGETIAFNLPDASEVILNSDSKIKFNQRKWSKRRELSLNGEAFFKVTKGQKFTVNTDQGMVQVLGTEFNVKSRNNYFEVACFEGLVSVTIDGNPIKVPAGTKVRLINSQFETFKIDQGAEPTWLSRESSFERLPLTFVLQEFKAQYGLNIKLKDLDDSQLFTGSFTHEDVNTALQSITIPLNLSYKIENDTVLIFRYGSN